MGGKSSQHLDVKLDESNYTEEWNAVVEDVKIKLLKNNPLDGEFDDERCRRVLKSFGGVLIREDPKCGCDDPRCPHKGRISPLANAMLQSELAACFKNEKKFEDVFDPEKEEKMTEGYRYGPEQGRLYRRLWNSVTIENGILHVPRFVDIFEGLIFEDDKIKTVTIGFNGVKMQLPVVDRRCLIKGFWLPLCALQVTDIQLRFETKETFKCQMIGGNLDERQKNYLNDNPIDISICIDKQPYKLRFDRGCALVYGPDNLRRAERTRIRGYESEEEQEQSHKKAKTS